MNALIAILQLGTAYLPLPYVEHCGRTQDPACRVARVTVDDLAVLHRLVSESLVTDPNEDPDDPWQVFPADRRGDCDDQALSTRAALMAFGIPARDMALVTGKVTEPDGRVVGHIVLVVTLDGRRWVLDRKVPQGIYEDGKRPYRWSQSARQSHEGILWRSGE